MLDVEGGGTTHKESDAQHAQGRQSKLPSVSEVRAIDEARNLYKSNTFRAQLDLLLYNFRPQEYKSPTLEHTLQKLYRHFTSLPSLPPVHPLEAEATLPKLISTKGTGRRKAPVSPSVRIPYPPQLPPQSAAWTVAFEPPETMNVVGSWANNHTVQNIDGTPFGVDVAVEMPARLFQEKDYRNFRIFHKRAFYLACLAASLVDSFSDFTVEYVAMDGDARMTTLLLSSCKDDSDALRFTIRIIPVLPDNAPLPRHRLSPAQCSIRVSAEIPSVGPQTDAERLHAGFQPPTPRYNNSLALSFARTSRTRLLDTHALVGMVPSFGDGLALLRIWADRRGYGAGHTLRRGRGSNYCVIGFEGLGAWWACILEVLILGEESYSENGGEKGKKKRQRPLVGKGLSSYQLFRAALGFLARRDFQTEPLLMKMAEHGLRFTITEWKAHYDAIFVDATGTVNMLANVPGCSLQLLRYDAANTLKLLDGPNDCFGSAFLMDMREPHTRFDAVISINLANIRYDASIDFPSTQMAIVHEIVATVRKALNTRAHAVVPLQPRSLPHPVNIVQPTSLSSLVLGIIFDPTHALRLVDHGPAASSAGVDDFRAFWGPKAELRRFKDGSIVESCVWDDAIVAVEDREGIPARIVRYILSLHFGVSDVDVCVLAGDYGRVISNPTVRGHGERGYKNALATLDKFVKELKALEEESTLPLMVISAKPCSPYLRYMSVFPPSSIPSSSKSMHPSTSYLPAFEVVLQFEKSSQWPDDLRAIQKVKVALFESIARGLSQRRGVSCQACVVVDQNASEIEDGYVLEVVLDGWAFHARVGHDRELTLLQDMLDRSTTLLHEHGFPGHEQQAATHSLQIYRRRFIHAPIHHGAILALHHKLPAFSYTVRLVKRWLGAHWLSARVKDEAVELICTQVFLSCEGDMPACGKRGFVRVVDFLRTWDGFAYVPLYEVIREADVATSNEQAMKAGKGSWRLATAEDASGTLWCEDVTIPVATRIREVAKATIACLAAGTQTIKPLFEHPTTDYDFLIELDPHAVSRYWQGMRASASVWNSSGYVNLTSVADDESMRVGFNPAEMFFRDLQRVYGDTMELFYDIHGGTTIGGVWNPVVRSAQHPWRVFLGFSSLPSTQGVQPKKGNAGVTFNEGSVLLEIQRLGEGIVTEITTRD